MESSFSLAGSVAHLASTHFCAEGAWATCKSAIATRILRRYFHPSCPLGTSGQLGSAATTAFSSSSYTDRHTIIGTRR